MTDRVLVALDRHETMETAATLAECNPRGVLAGSAQAKLRAALEVDPDELVEQIARALERARDKYQREYDFSRHLVKLDPEEEQARCWQAMARAVLVSLTGDPGDLQVVPSCSKFLEQGDSPGVVSTNPEGDEN